MTSMKFPAVLLCCAFCSVELTSAFLPTVGSFLGRASPLAKQAARRPFQVSGRAAALRMSGVEKKVLNSESSEYTIAILGDLHLDASDMELHHEGRSHVQAAFDGSPKSTHHMVSLGDLGAYGTAGTTPSFQLAKEYLDGFGVGWNVVTGNHDLEGMDEFETDEANLAAFCEGMATPHYFCTQVAEKAICVGLSTVRFRDTSYSSHEVFVDQPQIDWFEKVLEAHPESEGWSVFVFTHAPIMGSGLRTLQEVHIKNGCAWINHTDEKTRKRFFELCKAHPQIRAWFNGHFHLSHDYEESITVGGNQQAFVQVGVMGEKSMRDGRRQTRMLRGNGEGFEVYTINHHKGGEQRLDMRAAFAGEGEPPEVTLFTEHPDHIDVNTDSWFSARTPEAEDGCFLEKALSSDPEADLVSVADSTKEGVVCWWHMSDGRVLGVHDGILVEYDADTLAPLGVVVEKKAMDGKEVVIMEGGKVVMLIEQTAEGVETEVVHPNDDGSYWRKFQRNKLARTREKEREALAKLAAERLNARRSE